MNEPRWRRYLRFWIGGASRDVHYAIRGLRRQPAFVAAVVATLALAIAANLTVLSLVDLLFFRPPAGVVDAGSVRRVYAIFPNIHRDEPAFHFFEYDEYQMMRSTTRDIARFALEATIDSAGVSYVTADFLPLLGVHIERGRVFSEAEAEVNPPMPVAVISRRFADRVFGDSVNPLGGELLVEDRRYRVIGVIAPPFAGLGLNEMSVWVPFNNQPPRPVQSRVIMRPLPGVDLGTVEARVALAYQRVHLWAYAGATIVLAPLSDARGPRHRTREVMIAAQIGVVSMLLLVIACANAANLLLARAWTRRREFAIRAALGMSRARLATLVFFESLILAAAAGGVALLVGRHPAVLLRTQLLPRVRWSSDGIGLRSLLLSAALTLVAATLAGLGAALFASRHDAADALKSGTRFGTVRRGRLRGALLVVQAAVAVVLLAGAFLFEKSLRNVRDIDLGYDVDRLVIASVNFSDRTPHSEAAPLLKTLTSRIAALPGVAGAIATYGGPLDFRTRYPLHHETADSAPPIRMAASSFGVGPDYFRLTGTQIVEGRSLLASDNAGSAPVMVVGSGMAKKLWPHESALGHCLRPVTRSNSCYSIVGVAEDVHEFHVIVPVPAAQYYLPLDQLPLGTPVARTLIVRAGTMEPDVIADTVRRMLRETFPTEQIRAVSMARALELEMRSWILGARLSAVLGGLAILIAILGVYAMTAFDARQRMREIGVRIALGASGANVVSLFVRQGTILVATGVVLGVVAALASGRFVESVLYGVSPRDPGALATSATLLLLVAIAASLLSCRRAMRIDPTVILRDD